MKTKVSAVDGKGEWTVQRNGTLARYAKKADAIREARRILRHGRTSGVFIQGKAGRFVHVAIPASGAYIRQVLEKSLAVHG